MELGDLIETRPQLLIGYIQNHHLSYGDKFQRFSQQVFQSFERVAAIRFYQNQYAKQRLPLAVFGALLFIKNHRFLNDDFSGMLFLDDFENNAKAIAAANPNIKININKIMDLMKARISSTHLRHVFDVTKLSNEVHELMNLIAEYKGKGEVEHYNEEQIKRIGSVFGEKLVFINYDEDKSALNQTALSHRNIYLLKAKDMYFILFKEQDIELIEKGTVTHQELAFIFNIQSKLQKSPQKPNPNVDPNSVVLSPTKSSNDLKKSSKSVNQPSASQVQPKKGSQLALTKIKHSILFPDEVTCTYCCKKVSEFSAIFWSYNYYCFQCVLSPKKDISFIPSSLIQKFLKGQKIDSREYLLICPECKSDTIIPNYRPWDKPKNYRCKACQKEICVEHEKMVGECFCKCLECDKPTITIPTIFIKYCLNCKVRLCELCSLKSRKDCDCICPNCGQNQKVDHETCKPRCHSCFARDITLMPCQCNKKLCPACYFNSLEPKAAICMIK